MKDEALKLALEALEREEYRLRQTGQSQVYSGIGFAITAIKQALASPVQEPVEFFDWYDNAHWGNEDFKEGCHRSWNAAIKYTTPPAAQRQWVGLTEDDLVEVCPDNSTPMGLGEAFVMYGRAIEAKLKEKNNG
jgi:hypothetical protein